MEFAVVAGPAALSPGACAVVGVYEGGALSPSAMRLDAAASRLVSEVLSRGDFEAEPGAILLLPAIPGAPGARLMLVGLGAPAEFGEGRYHAALAAAIKVLRSSGATEAMLCLHEVPVGSRDLEWKLEQAVLAAMDGVYRLDRLKGTPPKRSAALATIVFPVPDPGAAPAAQAAVERAMAMAEGIALAKDLGNLPGNVCTPAYLADQARELGSRHGLAVQILEREDIGRLGMQALLAVASGSAQPPKLIVVDYRGGAEGSPPVVLVGKGVTFDSGGLTLKSYKEMEHMKFDMCGAASVLGALHAAARMKLRLNVVGIVPAAENMPDGEAIRPGDVVTTMSGQTVEILDTDSEGRLLLADALTYAERYRPAVVVDVATLTGAIVIALGDVGAGVFSGDEALVREVIAAGDRAWDRAWHMPLWPEYQERFKSELADFANVGPEGDSAITAACFLSRFTKAYPWVHLDVAGIVSDRDNRATGRPVALLAHFLAGRAGA